MGCPENTSWLSLHILGKIFYFSESHHPCLAIFHARWFKSSGNAFATKITMICWKWEVIQFPATYFRLDLHDMDSPFPDRSVVFLLTSYLTNMAADAKIVVYEQAIL
jgi:hypothetical protein